MCNASWPMASTSWVWLLRAMTVGALRTIPRPLAYTSVLAVPRSMARSLASPALPARDPALLATVAAPVPFGVGSECLELAGEALDVRLHRAGLAMTEPQDERAQQAQEDGDPQVDEVAHWCATSSISLTGWLHVAQSVPPAHVSRFQMGTVDLRVSMQKRAAPKASGRWGADATTTTDVSPTSRQPTRCRSATRPSTGHRQRASAAMAARRGTTSSS